MIKKGFEKEADDLGLTPEELVDGLKGTNMFNPSGSPKKKYVDSGIFTPDGDIRSPTKFEKTFDEKLTKKINGNL